MNKKNALDEVFLQNYGILNTEQKKAVDAIEGPVMVVAGPGTGKTQILTLRIANILRVTDTAPENILALTFTEAAATNMRGRLSRFVGSLAYRVNITTFHGFANEIIQDHAEFFPHIIGAQTVSEVEQIRIIEKIVIDNDFELLKPFGDNFYYVKAVRSAIDELKREGVDEKEFEGLVKKEKVKFEKIPDLYYETGAHVGKMKGKYKDQQKKLNKNQELSFIYGEYQKELRKQKRYDFADMLVELLRALRKQDDLKLQLQERYQYVLVDEHQDSNNAQNKILEKLMDFHDAPNLFVVGDEKQAIFRFQGASVENFYYFKRQYESAQMITLRQNYRSTQSILSLADSLMSGEQSLQSNSSNGDKLVQVYELKDPDQEVYFIATDIKQRIAKGSSPDEIAILYRNNRDAFAISEMLDRVGVPHTIQSDQDILAHPLAVKIISLFRGIVDYGNDSVLAKLLHLDIFDLDHLDIFKLIRSASQKRKYQLYDLLRDSKLRKGLNLEEENKILELYENLESWISFSNNEHVRKTASHVLRSSGLLQLAIGGEKAQENLAVIRKIFALIEDLSLSVKDFTLRDFLGYMDTMEGHNLSLRAQYGNENGRVKLMTVHRAKGLEFDYVYITKASLGRFGSGKRRNLLPLLPQVYKLYEGGESAEGSSEDDERRLFYVALTRARKQIFISYSFLDEAGKEVLPTPFLQEVKQELLEYMDVSLIEETYKETHGLITAPPDKLSVARLVDQEYVKNLFQKAGFSVSALNNYLKSPWQYFYRNLLRIPEPPNKHQAYGIAVHAALHDMFEKLKHQEAVFGVELLVASFVENLDRQIYLQEAEYQETRARGEKNLSLWYQENKDRWVRETLNEFRIPAVYLNESIRLTGVLDKVELLSNTEVSVVDYKTGKPRSRNDILGNTANSSGDYYRQLVFYKLLLRYWQDGRYKMKYGEIVFVEPDSSGKFRSEKFEITEEEVDDLEKEIHRVSEEIQNLDFWEKDCDPEVCDYCDLVKVLQNKNRIGL